MANQIINSGALPPAEAALPKYRLERTDLLVPYANNARTHSPTQIDKIAASIREFGFTNPVLIRADRGIIAGHGRVIAAFQLGLAEVPVIELAHLTPAQARAYILADNRLALDAGWDDDLVRFELTGLRDAEFDLSLTGFSDAEIAKLLGSPAELSGKAALGDGLQYQVVVDCENEADQAEVLRKIKEDGRSCRPLIL